VLQAERKAFLEMAKQRGTDQSLWWNKCATMTEEEADILPLAWVKKYGAYYRKIDENNQLNRYEENWNYEGRGKQI
jgi:hypothetical protein